VRASLRNPRRQRVVLPQARAAQAGLVLEAVRVADLARGALAAPVRARRRAQGDERRRVLAREPDAAVGAHPGTVAEDFDVPVSLLEADLEVGVRAVAGVRVVLPLGGEEGDGFAVR